MCGVKEDVWTAEAPGSGVNWCGRQEGVRIAEGDMKCRRLLREA